MDLFAFDREQCQPVLCGVDEAGRGPLAGPVVAAAAVLPQDAENWLSGVNDSKKLSEKKREVLAALIAQYAVSWAVGVASVEEIDRINILQATFLAMRRAVDGLAVTPSKVLVDGNKTPGLLLPSECVIGGDGKSASIAAASILAKVTRDRMMVQLDVEYPQYGFAKHKGYGTKLHNERILEYGISPVHRRTFLKKLQQKHPSISLLGGQFGEKMAYGYLCKHDYQLLARNYRSEYGEIDLIAAKDGFLCFVEVKMRDESCPYAAKEAVTKSKQIKIVKTALCFMQKHPSHLQPRFDIIEVNRTGSETCTVNLLESAFVPEAEYGFF